MTICGRLVDHFGNQNSAGHRSVPLRAATPTPTLASVSLSILKGGLATAARETFIMANWDYVLKFIICGDAAVGKSSLLVRLTDQRFLANPDPTVRFIVMQIVFTY